MCLGNRPHCTQALGSYILLQTGSAAVASRLHRAWSWLGGEGRAGGPQPLATSVPVVWQLHPDKRGGTAEAQKQFIALVTAYETLKGGYASRAREAGSRQPAGAVPGWGWGDLLLRVVGGRRRDGCCSAW
jgi:hypothetical protein